jgi:putative membrane protein
MMGFGWGMTDVAWIGMMVFWTLAGVAVLVFLARSFDGFAPQLPQAERSLELARERLAKGELSQEEFHTLKRTR